MVSYCLLPAAQVRATHRSRRWQRVEEMVERPAPETWAIRRGPHPPGRRHTTGGGPPGRTSAAGGEARGRLAISHRVEMPGRAGTTPRLARQPQPQDNADLADGPGLRGVPWRRGRGAPTFAGTESPGAVSDGYLSCPRGRAASQIQGVLEHQVQHRGEHEVHQEDAGAQVKANIVLRYLPIFGRSGRARDMRHPPAPHHHHHCRRREHVTSRCGRAWVAQRPVWWLPGAGVAFG